MKFKKRKKLIHLLIPRILIAWLLAGILTVISIVGFYRYITDVFIGMTQRSDATQIHQEQIKRRIRDGIWETNPGLVKMYVKAPYAIFDGIALPDELAGLNSMQYAELYDMEANQTLVDSSMFLTLIHANQGDIKDTFVYTNEFENLREIPEFREVEEHLQENDTSWKSFLGNQRGYYYAMNTKDFYIDTETKTFYPGTVEITEGSYKNRFTAEYMPAGADNISRKYTVDCTPYLKDKVKGFQHVVLFDGEYEDIHFQEIASSGGYIGDYVKGIGFMGSRNEENEYIKNLIREKNLFDSGSDFASYGRPGVFENGDLIVCSKFNIGGEYENLEYRYCGVIHNPLDTFTPVYGMFAVIYFVLFTVIAVLVSITKYRNLMYFYRNEDFRKTLMNSMAHDLKTPLSAMSGYAQNLKENVGTDKREHYAQVIEENANYMNGIITDILALSKMEENMLHPKKQSTDLFGVFREIADVYKDQLEEKKLCFICEGKFVRRVDPILVKRALENLFTNALKYTEEGGEIKVSAKHIPFHEQLLFENSPAKPIDCKTKKLWEPFVKGSESRTENNGTGVGLAIVKNILELHHMKGKIQVKDNLFRVKLK